jgi:acetyl esterase/lipase
MNSKKGTIGVVMAAVMTCVVQALAQAQVKKPDPVDVLAAVLEPSRVVTYKTTPQKPLLLHVFEPEGFAKTDKRAAFVTIHGGGWRGGVPRRMYPFADYFAKLGMVGISVEYRLAAQKPVPGGLTPFDCVQDVKSAIRYLKTHAAEMGIDPEKIVVSGGSAGGHLAVATALFDAVNDPQDDLKVSTMPAAMVLLFPVIDTSAEIGYGNALLGERWKEIDPNSHVRSGLPPTITFHGTGDTVTPFAGAEKFHQAMKAAGNESELVVNQGGVHGYLMFDRKVLDETLGKSAAFLRRFKLLVE